MTLSEQVPLADFKNHLSEVIDRVERQHGRVVITKRGRPAAVLISVADLESLEETPEVMRDPELVKALRESETEAAAGRTDSLTDSRQRIVPLQPTAHRSAVNAGSRQRIVP